jgi:hypothetical protein
LLSAGFAAQRKVMRTGPFHDHRLITLNFENDQSMRGIVVNAVATHADQG